MTAVGASSLMSVKKQPADAVSLFVSNGIPGTSVPTLGKNVVQFTIPNTAWKTVFGGLYGYDVQVTIGGLKDVVMPLSPFFVEETEAKV